MSLKNEHTIMVVDDEDSITKALHRLFRKENYQILTSSDPLDGLKMLKEVEKPVSLIISDQRMPGMIGSQFLEETKKIFPDAIRFLLTGYSDMDAIISAVNEGGIHRYLTKPWNDEDLMLQVGQSLEHYELVLENRSLEESLLDTIKLLSSLVETLNPMLGKYMKQTAALSRAVAEDYKLSKEELDQIEIAGMVHDIGLLGIPERIILKSEEDMTDKDFEIFSQHPVIGSICLETVERLKQVSKMVLYHHEQYDGHGFPHSLRGEEIPLGSRIICVVADYCKVLNTWPQDVDEIIQKARKYFGPAAQNIRITSARKMIGEIAKKIVLLGANQKYDIQVITTLIKKLGEREKEEAKKQKKILLLPIEKLEEGMVLAKNLRTQEGTVLLPKDATLKESSIESIKDLVERGVIAKQVHVILSSEQVEKLRKKRIEDIKNQKKILLIPMEELEEGMVLAKNLRTQEGRILLPKDAKLQESSIESIKDLVERGVIDDKIHVTV
jgi:response regulator RpfG family c-di-GMP phosphodiesterase